jgi:hypothetical protein
MTLDVQLVFVPAARCRVLDRRPLGRAAAILREAVDSARIAGCRRIRLDLDGAGSAGQSFVEALGQLRGSCTKAGGSLEVNGLALVARVTESMPGPSSAPAVGTGKEAPHGCP